MLSPYDILGIASSASIAEAQLAFRRLAQRHHPDKGGNEETFKSIKQAFEQIKAGWKPEPISSTSKPQAKTWSKTQWHSPQKAYNIADDPEYDFSFFSTKTTKKPYVKKEADEQQKIRVTTGFDDSLVVYVSLREALSGFICEATVKNITKNIRVPPGVPNGIKFMAEFAPGIKRQITVIFRQSDFRFSHIESAQTTTINTPSGIVKICKTGDLFLTKRISYRESFSLNHRSIIDFTNIVGKRCKVSPPSNFDFRRDTILVPGEGYVHWDLTNSRALSTRADLRISIVPDPECVPMSTFY